jgi:hypothetical protein
MVSRGQVGTVGTEEPVHWLETPVDGRHQTHITHNERHQTR